MSISSMSFCAYPLMCRAERRELRRTHATRYQRQPRHDKTHGVATDCTGKIFYMYQFLSNARGIRSGRLRLARGCPLTPFPLRRSRDAGPGVFLRMKSPPTASRFEPKLCQSKTLWYGTNCTSSPKKELHHTVDNPNKSWQEAARKPTPYFYQRKVSHSQAKAPP